MYRRGRKPCQVAIRSTASEADFYTLKSPNPGISHTAPDEFLKSIESKAAPIIKRLLTTLRLELSEDETIIIAAFVATLTIRTPMARERAKNSYLSMRMKLLQDLAEDPQEYHKIVAQLNLTKTWEEAENIRKQFLNIEEAIKMTLTGEVDDFTLQRSFNTGELLAQMLIRKHWVLIQAPSKHMFVTSDNPFVLLVPDAYIPGMDVNPINAECLFPISPQRAILFSNKLKFKTVYKLSKERMKSLAWQTITFGYESVFASFSSDYIQEEFDKIPPGEITKIPPSSLPPIWPMMKS